MSLQQKQEEQLNMQMIQEYQEKQRLLQAKAAFMNKVAQGKQTPGQRSQLSESAGSLGFCGIYSSGQSKRNPHMNPKAQTFRSEVFQKLRQLGKK